MPKPGDKVYRIEDGELVEYTLGHRFAGLEYIFRYERPSVSTFGSIGRTVYDVQVSPLSAWKAHLAVVEEQIDEKRIAERKLNEQRIALGRQQTKALRHIADLETSPTPSPTSLKVGYGVG